MKREAFTWLTDEQFAKCLLLDIEIHQSATTFIVVQNHTKGITAGLFQITNIGFIWATFGTAQQAIDAVAENDTTKFVWR